MQPLPALCWAIVASFLTPLLDARWPAYLQGVSPPDGKQIVVELLRSGQARWQIICANKCQRSDGEMTVF